MPDSMLPVQLNRRGLLQLGGAVAALTALGACSMGPTTPATKSSGTTGPRAGGDLIIGVAGGGPSDTLDAHSPIGDPDISRCFNLYDTLAEYTREGAVGLVLASSIEPEDGGATWIVKLRDGLTFHDGSPIEAQDVIATLLRITDPDKPKSLASALTTMVRQDLKAVDRLTARIPFSAPNVVFPETLADYKAGIVPRTYDPSKPIGSGPFMASSFTPGQRSTFKKFPGYWQEGRPYVDSLTIINFADPDSRVNALQSGQVHAITSLPFAQVPAFSSSADFAVLETETDNWRPFGMHCGVEPFSDVRVRQALRLCVDREQMVAQALSGHGRVGNDIWSPSDPATPKLEQRVQDLAQARSLLKSAGYDGLQIQIDTAPVVQGLVEFATIFAEQARGVVDVRVNKIPAANYYGDNYLKYPFSMDYKGNRSFLRTAQQSGLLDSPYNPAHFDDSEYLSLVKTALVTIDEAKRTELIGQAQHILHEKGGYIVPVFTNLVDAHSKRIGGLRIGRDAGLGLPLGEYAFHEVYFTA
jgi:peptide/nickel transport system substrate-binding protein